MDHSKFFEISPGVLVPAHTPEPDWAFVPNPLSPSWKFPDRLWPLLIDARAALAQLNGIAQTLPDPDLLLKPLENREALRSSSLEGTYASPQQLLMFELDPREPISEEDPANSWLEVYNYRQSLRRGLELLKTLPFSLRLIKELHFTLMQGVRGRDRSPGEFRRYQVHIGSDRRFVPTPVSELDSCLTNFEQFLNEEEGKIDPLVKCYLCHYQFETIHPFVDGNGRVGRALMSLMIAKWCKLSSPWLYMSAYFERYKDEYVDKLFAVSTLNDWESWIEFCLRGTVEQSNDAADRCIKLRALKEQFHKRIDASVRSHAIIESLFSAPLLTITQVQNQHAISYPTAKGDIERLVKANILSELPDTYPKKYYASEIFKIAYNEPES